MADRDDGTIDHHKLRARAAGDRDEADGMRARIVEMQRRCREMQHSIYQLRQWLRADRAWGAENDRGSLH